MPRFIDSFLDSITPIVSELFQSRCWGCDRITRGPLCSLCSIPDLVPMSLQADVVSLLWFQGPWRKILHAIKYRNRFDLLRLFKPYLEKEILDSKYQGFAVIPVPIHYKTLRVRGFNQAEALGEWLAGVNRMPFLPDALVKIRATPSQSTGGLKDRKKNLLKSFRWVGGRKPNGVLLVDDVYTSGSTLKECSETLKKAGISEVAKWTLFRTP